MRLTAPSGAVVALALAGSLLTGCSGSTAGGVPGAPESVSRSAASNSGTPVRQTSSSAGSVPSAESSRPTNPQAAVESSGANQYSPEEQARFVVPCVVGLTDKGFSESRANDTCGCAWRGIQRTVAHSEITAMGVASPSAELAGKINAVTVACQADLTAY